MIFKWREKFIDVRDCYVEADSYKDAVKKRNSGDWLEEVTVDFYSDELIDDLKEVRYYDQQ